LTFIATQSMPIVSYFPIICATRLGPDPVGAQRETGAADIDHIGEIADRQFEPAQTRFGQVAVIRATMLRNPHRPRRHRRRSLEAVRDKRFDPVTLARLDRKTRPAAHANFRGEICPYLAASRQSAIRPGRRLPHEPTEGSHERDRFNMVPQVSQGWSAVTSQREIELAVRNALAAGSSPKTRPSSRM